MFTLKLLLSSGFVALVAIASPVEVVSVRQSGTICNGVTYSSAEVSLCETTSCSLASAGNTRTSSGGSRYPHTYNNYEGFTFKGLTGPFWEYPLITGTSSWNGGSPGAARCIIEKNSCSTAGQIVHSGSTFVACTGTS
ncbi:hypothetical protein ACN47E_003553 [Coniothyrium glycines]